MVYTMGKMQGLDDNQIFEQMIVQAGTSGAFRAGGKLHEYYSRQAGRVLTEGEVRTAFSKDKGTILGGLEESVGRSASKVYEVSLQKVKEVSGRVKSNTKEVIAEYGNRNVIATREKVTNLQRWFNDSAQLNGALIPPQVVTAAARIAYHGEATARSFADFSVRMVKEFGPEIKPRLAALYRIVNRELGIVGDESGIGRVQAGKAESRELEVIRAGLSEQGKLEFDIEQLRMGDDGKFLQWIKDKKGGRIFEGLATAREKSAASRPEVEVKRPVVLREREAIAWGSSGVGEAVEKVLTRRDLSVEFREEVRQTLRELYQAKEEGRLDINGNRESFNRLMEDMGKGSVEAVQGAYAELKTAAEVVRRGDIKEGTSVGIGIQYGQGVKGLPEIDVVGMEADVYYQSRDGVIHVVEVKNTPVPLYNVLDKSIGKAAIGKPEEAQFGRYGKWIDKGNKGGQVREVEVRVVNSGPSFHELLNVDRLDELSKTIVKDPSKGVIKIGDYKLSYNDLVRMESAKNKKLTELLTEANKRGININREQLEKQYFSTIEDAFRTLGREYGVKEVVR
jgi:hypothetical protein